MMKKPQLLLGLALLIFGGNLLHAQQEDGGWTNRLATEKGWVKYSDALGRPEAVEKLYIRNKAPLNVDVLTVFNNLTSLIIVDSEIKDLSFLSHFPDLTVFECQGNQLKSLEGIQVLTQAEEISVKSNFITDLSPLKGLSQLKMLNLYENDIVSLESIAHLKDITHLDLSKNRIRDIHALEGWTELEYLSLYSCFDLQNIDEITTFRKLKSLNLSFLSIDGFSLNLLNGLSSLQNLRIQGMVNSDEEVRLLARHTTLKGLTMGKNDNVTDLRPLATLQELEYLDIHSNNVSDLSVAGNWPHLVKLVMYRNQVTDIAPLQRCTHLRSLFMFENPIADYSPLLTMTHLQHLHVTRSHFTKAKAMKFKAALTGTKLVYM